VPNTLPKNNLSGLRFLNRLSFGRSATDLSYRVRGAITEDSGSVCSFAVTDGNTLYTVFKS
jgi:hypothetical protein